MRWRRSEIYLGIVGDVGRIDGEQQDVPIWRVQITDGGGNELGNLFQIDPALRLILPKSDPNGYADQVDT